MIKKLVRGTLRAGIVLGGMAAYNLWADMNAGPLRDLLEEGEARYYAWREGRIHYKVKGEGPPLLLLHSHNVAASAYELRHQYDGLASSFRVYAPDLLGYGLSDRPPLYYSAELYVNLVRDFVDEVIGQATHVIASTLSAAHVIRAAARAPDRFRKLVLILPTGIESLASPPSPVGVALQEVLRSPVVGTFLYNLLVSRTALAFYLKHRAYFEAHRFVTQELCDLYFTLSHQPGAKYAPAAALSGHLNLNIEADYRQLPHPVFVVWGQQAPFPPVQNCQAFKRLKPNVRLRVFDCCRLLPQDEHAQEFNTLVSTWLQEDA